MATRNTFRQERSLFHDCNWKANPQGETYRDEFIERGGSQEVWQRVLDLSGAYEDSVRARIEDGQSKYSYGIGQQGTEEQQSPGTRHAISVDERNIKKRTIQMPVIMQKEPTAPFRGARVIFGIKPPPSYLKRLREQRAGTPSGLDSRKDSNPPAPDPPSQ
jgi:hypothetical protein